MRNAYPESVGFGCKARCFGMIAEDVGGLRLYNVAFTTEKEGTRDEALFINVNRCKSF